MLQLFWRLYKKSRIWHYTAPIKTFRHVDCKCRRNPYSLSKGEYSSEEGIESISFLINEIVDFDMDQAKEAADLNPKVKHKGLSLGDRACLALGIKYKAKIYTANKVWKDIHPELDIRLIR